ncbi:hypothetical protein B0H14DRAFT_3733476, partial [Mycena olivaceomarginata]
TPALARSAVPAPNTRPARFSSPSRAAYFHHCARPNPASMHPSPPVSTPPISCAATPALSRLRCVHSTRPSCPIPTPLPPFCSCSATPTLFCPAAASTPRACHPALTSLLRRVRVHATAASPSPSRARVPSASLWYYILFGVFHNTIHESVINTAFSHTARSQLMVSYLRHVSASTRSHNRHSPFYTSSSAIVCAHTHPRLNQEGPSMHPGDLSQALLPVPLPYISCTAHRPSSTPLTPRLSLINAQRIHLRHDMETANDVHTLNTVAARTLGPPRTTSRMRSSRPLPPTPLSSSPRAPRLFTASCVCSAHDGRSPSPASPLSPPYTASASPASRTRPIHARASPHSHMTQTTPRHTQHMGQPLPIARIALITSPRAASSPTPRHPPLESSSCRAAQVLCGAPPECAPSGGSPFIPFIASARATPILWADARLRSKPPPSPLISLFSSFS